MAPAAHTNIEKRSAAPVPVRQRFLVLSGIALVVALLAAELGLRVVTGLGNPILYRPDPECGYITLPHQHLRRLLARTDLNSQGLRSPEVAVPKPPHTLRLLFLGDSITYGTTRVNQNDIFVELVRNALQKDTGEPVEEINASANGWAITNEFGFLHSRGTYNADCVIDVLNSGDLAQPVSTMSGVSEMATRKPATAIGELLSKLAVRGKQDAGTNTETDPQQEKRNLHALSEMAAFVHQKGSRFAVVYIPFRRDVTTGAQLGVPGALLAWAHSQRVRLIDLTAAISAYPVAQITNPDRTHFNVLGNQLIARSLEPQLASWIRADIAEQQQPIGSAGVTALTGR